VQPFIERELQPSSTRETPMKTTFPHCIMPPRIWRAFDMPKRQICQSQLMEFCEKH
jgi:hypothetical protein